jgi:ubiquinone/menaquinone biosynthesis C-methylase UbiE
MLRVTRPGGLLVVAETVKAGTWRFTGALLMYLAAGRKPS